MQLKNLFVHIQKWSTTTQTLQGLIRVSYSPWQDFDQKAELCLCFYFRNCFLQTYTLHLSL